MKKKKKGMSSEKNNKGVNTGVEGFSGTLVVAVRCTF